MDPRPQDGAGAAGQAGSGPEDGGWSRLHPLSPVLRGGVVFIGFVGYLLSQVWDRLWRTLGAALPGETDDPVLEGTMAAPLLVLGGVVVVLALVVGGAYLSWRMTRYRIDATQIELRHGWVFRQHRQVPLDRIQSVDVTAPLLARLFGLAQVVVRSAGGAGSHLTLAFLSASQAAQVRDRLQDLAARSDGAAPAGPEGGGAAPAGPAWSGHGEATPGGIPAPGGLPGQLPPAGRLLVSVPNGRLLGSTLLHGSTIVLAVFLVVGVLALVRDFPFSPAAFIPMVFGLGVSRVNNLLKNGNFRASATPAGDALRIDKGLTELRAMSVPLHRVQAVQIRQSWLWRRAGWWRVEANIAGNAVLGEDDIGSVLLPVGTTSDLHALLAVLVPQASPQHVEEGLFGSETTSGWTGVSERARLLDPLVWRSAGYAVSGPLLLIRRGRLTRTLVLVPHARIQSLTVTQGPLQRSRDLASVKAISTPGTVSAQVEHLSTAEAERLLHEQSLRSRIGRAATQTVADTATRQVN